MTTGRINQITITELYQQTLYLLQSCCTIKKNTKSETDARGKSPAESGIQNPSERLLLVSMHNETPVAKPPNPPEGGQGARRQRLSAALRPKPRTTATQRHTTHKKCRSTHDASHRHTAPTRTLDLPLADSTTRSEGGAIRDTWRPSHYLLSFDIAPTFRKCFLRHQQASQPLPPRGRGGRHLDRASALLPGSQA